MDLDPIRRKLLDLIERRGSDLKNTSLAIGRNAAYLHQFIYKGTPKALSEDVREALAAYLGCDEKELRHRFVPPRKPRTFHAANPVQLVSSGLLPEGYIAVREIDVRASAGAGAVNDGFVETKAQWVFPEAVIRYELRANPKTLRMITIDGDSMEPMLSSGDRILIDTAQRVPAPPGIFVIWDGIGLVAKRVEHKIDSDPPSLIIKSINPDYETYERYAQEVHIAGRVIWAARRL